MDRPRLGDDDLAEVDAVLADADAGVSAASGAGILGRQPVHTLYVPADRVRARHAASCGEEALDAVFRHAPDPVTLGRVTGLDGQLLWEVFPRLFRKLHEEPVEDLRVDLEDGYGLRPDDVEDAHVATSVSALLSRPEQAPPRWGVRIKSLEPSTRRRALRSLDLAIGAVLDAGSLPEAFTVTLPKVSSADQVRALALACDRLEAAYALPPSSLGIEVQVETPRAVLGPDGTVTLARAVQAGGSRVSGLHFGTYDYTAALGVGAAQQALDHPAADHAKAVMQVAAAATGVRVCDGSTNMLPVGTTEQVHAAWALHARLVTRSLERGFPQGWDLHPAQLVTRYLATFAFYRRGLPAAARRLSAYLAGSTSGVLDEPATARALALPLLRGLQCGALDDDEVRAACGLGADDLGRVAATGRPEAARAEAARPGAARPAAPGAAEDGRG